MGKLSFITGSLFGIYITQNYNVPNVKKVVNRFLSRAIEVEEKHRKPKMPGDDV